MPIFEVDYTYLAPQSEVMTVDAKDMDDAERKALDQLSDQLPEEVEDLVIDAIRELR
jgi:hypothetical protein